MTLAKPSLAAVGALAGLALTGLAPTGPALAQQPPPQSPYADGTGNSAVGTLNSGQLDQHYTGPWHRVPPGQAVGGPVRAAVTPDTAPPQPAAAPSTPVPPRP